MKSKIALLAIALMLIFGSSFSVSAISESDRNAIYGNAIFFDRSGSTGQCYVSTGEGQLLPKNVTEALSPNFEIYQSVGQQEDIPWQMLAAIHFRETNGRRYNPSNGQGVYQFFAKAGEYPAKDSLTDTEFRAQTVEAAKFIKSKMTSIPQEVRSPLSSNNWNNDTVKALFFAYNGQAQIYKDQAVELGLIPASDRNIRGFEGSPYVMNLYDSIRDSSQNPNWKQVLKDPPPQNVRERMGPANQQIGAWPIFESLAGVRCSNAALGDVAARIVQIAYQELALDVKEVPDGSNSGPIVDKYTDGVAEYWCADFVSWVLREAGAPLDGGLSGGWRIPSSRSIGSWYENNAQWYDKQQLLSGEARAMPGDIYVKKRGTSPSAGHIGIVVDVSADGKTLTTIDGNLQNSVLKRTYSITDSEFLGVGRR